jgi:hypothetical protein
MRSSLIAAPLLEDTVHLIQPHHQLDIALREHEHHGQAADIERDADAARSSTA